MLVLGRKCFDSIMIGDDIEVKVLRFDERHGKTQVYLGISSPPNVRIIRKEIMREEPKKGKPRMIDIGDLMSCAYSISTEEMDNDADALLFKSRENGYESTISLTKEQRHMLRINLHVLLNVLDNK